jgi:hypothetical protein
MNKIYVEDIISIVNYIIKKDPYDPRHHLSNWEFQKRIEVIWGITNVKCFHTWKVESNADAEAIIEATQIKDATDKNIDFSKVLYLTLELRDNL